MPGRRFTASATFWSGSLPTSLACNTSTMLSETFLICSARRSAARDPVTTTAATESDPSCRGISVGALSERVTGLRVSPYPT